MIAILDTETTGTDPAVDRAIEVAVVRMTIDPLAIFDSYSSLIHADANPAEAVNRIPAALLAVAPSAESVWSEVFRRIEHCGVILAHKAEFDRQFVDGAIRDGKPWICTLDDVQWPRGGGTLVATALAHGLGVAHAHRALSDCLLLARLIERLPELGVDVRAFLKRGLRPKAKFRALVSYETNALAKAAGFRWDPEARMWWRTMAVEDVGALPFKTVMVPGPRLAPSSPEDPDNGETANREALRRLFGAGVDDFIGGMDESEMSAGNAGWYLGKDW